MYIKAENKHSYFRQWTRFTEDLYSSEASIPGRLLFALARLFQCDSGLLWVSREDGLELLEHWNTSAPGQSLNASLEKITQFAEQHRRAIDIGEYIEKPSRYPNIELPGALLEHEDAWLLIPLIIGDKVIGVAMLGKPEGTRELSPEDHELLKLAGRQAASELAQYRLSLELNQARQFEACNRISVYVIHDLKNILAQQSLIVSNAEKHKRDPAFVDDVLSTVKNSVARMNKLMEQMKSGKRAMSAGDVDIGNLLQEVVDRHSTRAPRPTLKGDVEKISALADREHLATVFGHIIQNAQEACRSNGQVEVELEYLEHGTAEVYVRDNGVGMEQSFVDEHLFEPFISTKGVTGMGIGAFESREYICSLGGDIEVTSTPGEGSQFRVVIPARPIEPGSGEWPLTENTC